MPKPNRYASGLHNLFQGKKAREEENMNRLLMARMKADALKHLEEQLQKERLENVVMRVQATYLFELYLNEMTEALYLQPCTIFKDDGLKVPGDCFMTDEGLVAHVGGTVGHAFYVLNNELQAIRMVGKATPTINWLAPAHMWSDPELKELPLGKYWVTLGKDNESTRTTNT